MRVIDSYELIFVTRGHLDMFEDQRHFHLERNQALVLRPRSSSRRPSPLRGGRELLLGALPRLTERPRDITLAVPRVATVGDPEALSELFRRFISDQESGILDPLSASHLVALMVCMISEEKEETRSFAMRGEQASLADAVHRYIETNYARPITTSAIARDLHYNADYMERVFRGRWRMSIIDALHQKRIGMARASLNGEPGKNVNEIAFECGYTDPGYFRRMFKRLTGLTPREFRTLYARTHINTH